MVRSIVFDKSTNGAVIQARRSGTRSIVAGIGVYQDILYTLPIDAVIRVWELTG
jgi:hypothetical protein